MGHIHSSVFLCSQIDVGKHKRSSSEKESAPLRSIYGYRSGHDTGAQIKSSLGCHSLPLLLQKVFIPFAFEQLSSGLQRIVITFVCLFVCL